MANKSFIQRMRDLFSPKTTPSVRANKVSVDIRNVPKNIPLAGGGRLVNARSESAALSAIADAASRGKRIQITVTDNNYAPMNGAAQLYTGGRMMPNGIDATYLLEHMEDLGLGLDEMLNSHHSESGCGPLPELGDIALYTIREL